MLHLDKYPAPCASVLAQFAPAVPLWAAASGFTKDDVRQEITLAVLAGEDPARAVPTALGIRKVGGPWRPIDATVWAGSYNFTLDTDSINGEPSAAMPAPRFARGNMAAGISADSGIGLRAAQKRLKRQRDLFELGR
jgi:hypothetical protein